MSEIDFSCKVFFGAILCGKLRSNGKIVSGQILGKYNKSFAKWRQIRRMLHIVIFSIWGPLLMQWATNTTLLIIKFNSAYTATYALFLDNLLIDPILINICTLAGIGARQSRNRSLFYWNSAPKFIYLKPKWPKKDCLYTMLCSAWKSCLLCRLFSLAIRNNVTVWINNADLLQM